MPLSEEKIQAYKALDHAVELLTLAYRTPENPDGIQTGYLLLVGEVSFADENDGDDDDQEMKACLGIYEKRGQNPHLSLGLVTDYQAMIRDN